MTITEQREAASLYKENAAGVTAIASLYGVHSSTIYDVLDRFNVPRQRPGLSLSASLRMKQYWNSERAKAQQTVYSPDLRDQYLVAEQPSPSAGVDIDAVHVKATRKPRKRKSWLRRTLDKLFGRR